MSTPTPTPGKTTDSDRLRLRLRLRLRSPVTYNNKHFDGDFTFRKRARWISQLDWCLCSFDILSNISDFAVLANSPLRGDHAALAVVVDVPGPNIDLTLERARLLNAYPKPKPKLERKPISFCSIRPDIYRGESFPPAEGWLRDQETRLESWAPDQSAEAISDLCNNVTDTTPFCNWFRPMFHNYSAAISAVRH